MDGENDVERLMDEVSDEEIWMERDGWRKVDEESDVRDGWMERWTHLRDKLGSSPSLYSLHLTPSTVCSYLFLKF
jgi:hypothetical protein